MLQSSPVIRAEESDHGDGDETTGEGDTTTVCPLCGIATEDAIEIYTHLQVGHKKSELARLITDR